MGWFILLIIIVGSFFLTRFLWRQSEKYRVSVYVERAGAVVCIKKWYTESNYAKLTYSPISISDAEFESKLATTKASARNKAAILNKRK